MTSRTAGSVPAFDGQHCSLPAAAFPALWTESLRPLQALHNASVLHSGPKKNKSPNYCLKGDCSFEVRPPSVLPLVDKLKHVCVYSSLDETPVIGQSSNFNQTMGTSCF